MVEVTYRLVGYKSKWVVKVERTTDVLTNLTNNRTAFISCDSKAPIFASFNVKRIS